MADEKFEKWKRDWYLKMPFDVNSKPSEQEIWTAAIASQREESAIAYAKGASDMLKQACASICRYCRKGFLVELNNGTWQHIPRKMDDTFACNATKLRSLPIPAAQPRDLGKLWEFHERLEEFSIKLADQLAAILKEMEESR